MNVMIISNALITFAHVILFKNIGMELIVVKFFEIIKLIIYYKKKTPRYHKVIKSFHNEPCTNTYQCRYSSGLVCQNDVCDCQTDYFWNGSYCGRS